MKIKTRTFLFSFILLSTQFTYSGPFENCPSNGFLVQSSVAKLYGVNLATGYYEVLSDSMGTSGKLNAMGYSIHDNYMYAYSSEYKTVVRIHSDYQIEQLDITGIPNKNFYVGDVSLSENSYFFYRPGSSYGLYKVSLESAANNYLEVEKIISGSDLNLSIYDFAFHPDRNVVFSVDSSGRLIEIDIASGSYQVLRNVGERGTFGAVYFDVEGQLYISRNSDGYIFRINIDADGEGEGDAEFYAYGPNSSNNDGARCAVAAIITEDSTVDFGDAPSSYGTSIEDNGARHEASGDMFLGESVGGENDGVNFVTGLETNVGGMLTVEAKGEGYLNAWVDWNKSGQFDESEQVVEDKALKEGQNRVFIDVPEDAVTGSTWSRIRYSSTKGIGPTGGVSDGEVEDYEVVVTDPGLSVVNYPSGNAYSTVAYEDRWPELGDYDMNDVVVSYRNRVYLDEESRVVRVDVEGRILALGAGYHNGFAVMFDDIPTENINSELIRFEVNQALQADSPLEANADSDDAVIIIAEDLWQQLSGSQDCQYYRTERGCQEVQAYTFSVSVPLNTPVSLSEPSKLVNPFIFASPGWYHGDAFATPPGRSLEIHLKNRRVSARFNHSYFGLNDDASDSSIGRTFSSSSNLPWAIEIPVLWSHPLERVDISKAYPEFPGFVRSQGQENKSWYLESKKASDLTVINW